VREAQFLQHGVWIMLTGVASFSIGLGHFRILGHPPIDPSHSSAPRSISVTLFQTHQNGGFYYRGKIAIMQAIVNIVLFLCHTTNADQSINGSKWQKSEKDGVYQR
jgi:hypothetical protein